MNKIIALFFTALLPMAATATMPVPKFVVHQNAHVRMFRAYVQKLTSGKYLYTQVHTRHFQGKLWSGGEVDYYAPDGRLVAHKVLRFSGRSDVPVYRFDMEKLHFAEGVSGVSAQHVKVFTQTRDDPAPRRAAVDRDENMVADRSGVERFIQQHFGELMKGDKVVNRVSPPDLSVDEVKIKRLKDGKVNGKTVVRFKLEAASLLHVFFGQPQFFSFDPKTHRLVEYRGLSELRNPKTGKAYRVRVQYGGKAPANAPDMAALNTHKQAD